MASNRGCVPWLQDADVVLYHGDVLATLRELPDESVDCVVTSPPYWGLRDYGQEGQLGLEPTPEQYVERMVEVFREVRRVLAAHGSVWLNLGDSYYAAGWESRRRNEVGAGSFDPADRRSHTGIVDGLKVKDLVGIPWRVAFALQADGWYLRSDIIWSKPNPMPESVTDRPTKAHEYVFLLSKQPRYFFDQEAVREQFEARPQQQLTKNIDMPLGPARVAAGVQQGNPQGGAHVSRFTVQSETLAGVCGCHDAGCGRSFHADDCGCACHDGEQRGPDGRRKTHVEAANGSIQHRDGERWPNSGRNIRSVWEIATQPYPEAHFATFPEKLARRCIAAGCPEQVCADCGTPWVRITESKLVQGRSGNTRPSTAGEADQGQRRARDGHVPGMSRVVSTLGREPTCKCSRVVTSPHWMNAYGLPGTSHAPTRPGIVLDPFMGSGTVAFVARKLGRHSIGVDLNVDYLTLAARRLQQQSLFAEPVA